MGFLLYGIPLWFKFLGTSNMEIMLFWTWLKIVKFSWSNETVSACDSFPWTHQHLRICWLCFFSCHQHASCSSFLPTCHWFQNQNWNVTQEPQQQWIFHVPPQWVIASCVVIMLVVKLLFKNVQHNFFFCCQVPDCEVGGVFWLSIEKMQNETTTLLQFHCQTCETDHCALTFWFCLLGRNHKVAWRKMLTTIGVEFWDSFLWTWLTNAMTCLSLNDARTIDCSCEQVSAEGQNHCFEIVVNWTRQWQWHIADQHGSVSHAVRHLNREVLLDADCPKMAGSAEQKQLSIQTASSEKREVSTSLIHCVSFLHEHLEEFDKRTVKDDESCCLTDFAKDQTMCCLSLNCSIMQCRWLVDCC